MRPAELRALTIARALDLLRTKQVSAADLAESCLGRIEALNPSMHVFISVTAELARAQARAGAGGRLAGIPIAFKDLIDTRGIRTSAGSRVFAERVPSEDADVVHTMREAGAVTMGKTNMHEFAYGTTNVNTHYGTPPNPRDLRRITGGSSGGSASAIALDMALGAWGSDTGGSIRIPAALCGVVGFKPTFGLVSTRGVVPLSPSLDHCGPLAKTVEDVALLMGIRTLDPGVKHLRVGLPRTYFFERLDPEVEGLVGRAVRVLENLGARTLEVHFPSAARQQEVFSRIAGREAFDFHRPLIESHREAYGAEVLARIEAGARVSETDYAEAQQVRKGMKDEYTQALDSADVILTPTTPITAPYIDQAEVLWPDGAEALPSALTRYTRWFNMVGAPAVSVPCGFTTQGLPVGLQIAGKPGDDATVLRVAATYHAAAGWTGCDFRE